ncbi:hypothetical protein QQX98_011503 [Neonectria punicea]|uniref:F-box domain-containing protein n=1 Tax=Neonectria punicea TaxID=979145 RepID=A0ABR1GLG0_9HYPO
MSSSAWALPIELIRHIALQLSLTEPYDNGPDTIDFMDFIEAKGTLMSLTYACRSTKTLLEPLLYRCIILLDAQDVTHVFLLLTQNPHLCSYVRHIFCNTPLAWIPSAEDGPRSVAMRMWQARCDLETSPKALLKHAGLDLDYNAATEVPIGCLAKDLFKLDDFVNFMFGCILIMTQNTRTLGFRRSAVRYEGEEPFIFSGLMVEAAKQGFPVMPDLRVLDFHTDAESLSEVIDMFFPKDGMWTNLRRLVLNDVDFDDQFFQMLVEGSFSSPQPIEELYIRDRLLLNSRLDDFDIGLGGDGDVTFAQVMDMFDIDLEHRPKFRAFRNLRLLDIEFPQSDFRAEHGSPVLPVFLAGIGSVPETIRLRCHPFPSGLIKLDVQSRLKYLIIDECNNMSEVPTGQEIAEAASRLRDDGGDVAPTLSWVQVNGVRKEIAG